MLGRAWGGFDLATPGWPDQDERLIRLACPLYRDGHPSAQKQPGGTHHGIQVGSYVCGGRVDTLAGPMPRPRLRLGR
jgi:hypothetical protein